jgi:hypothetical protein
MKHFVLVDVLMDGVLYTEKRQGSSFYSATQAADAPDTAILYNIHDMLQKPKL